MTAGSFGLMLLTVFNGTFCKATLVGKTSRLVISGRKFCWRYGTFTDPSRGERVRSAVRTARHWMNLAFGLGVAPAPSTFCQSDHVLSGVLVFPVLVEISIPSPSPDLHEILPQEEMESVSLTFDSYVPEVDKVSPTRKSFPMFAVAAYRRFPVASSRVVCSSLDSTSNVTFLGPSSE